MSHERYQLVIGNKNTSSWSLRPWLALRRFRLPFEEININLRADDKVARIVEHKDATAEEREIDEINTAIYCFRRSVLAPALRRVQPANAQGEYGND